jgi:hypothetical protein
MSSTTNITYYVSVDSQYRDDSKYPLETDFGVKFKATDLYATYPDQSFFYPQIADLYTNTGAYNPPNIAPDPSSITGSGIVYPQGEPLDTDQPFARLTIDKNFIDQPIQVKGGVITQIKEYGSYVFVCGIIPFTPAPNNNFAVVVNDVTFFKYTYSTSIVPSILRGFDRVFVASLQRLTERTYIPVNMIVQNPVDPLVQWNSIKYVDMQIDLTLNFVYLMFDFKANEFIFTRVFYEDNITGAPIISNYGAVLNLPQLYEKQTEESAYVTPTSNQEWSNVMIVGFNSQLSSVSYFNNAPWGYHVFKTLFSYDMLPSRNGTNQFSIDAAGNIFAAVHIDQSSMNTYEETMSLSTHTPLINNVRRTPSTGIKNSKPLGGYYYSFPTTLSVILCSDGTNYSSYDVYLQLFTIVGAGAFPYNFPPQITKTSLSVGGAGSLLSSNDASFFSFGGNNYFAINSVTGFGLMVWQLTNVPSVVFTAGTLFIGPPIVAVEALDTFVTDVSNPTFAGDIAVAAITNEGANFVLYLYQFAGGALNLLDSITIGGPAYMLKVQQIGTQVNIFVVRQDSYIEGYYYDDGAAALVAGSVEYVTQTTVIPQDEGQCSSINTYSFSPDGISFFYFAVIAFDQKAYVFRVSTNGYVYDSSSGYPLTVANSSTFNLYFTELAPTFTASGTPKAREYFLGSNQYTDVANIFNTSLLPTTYQVGKSFSKGPQNLWYARDSSTKLLHGFTRSEVDTADNKFYLSIAAPIIQSTVPIESVHVTQPVEVSYIPELPASVNWPAFPDFMNGLTYYEYVGSTQFVIAVSNQGNLLAYDVAQFPTYELVPNFNINQFILTVYTGIWTIFAAFTSVQELSPGNFLGYQVTLGNNGVDTAWIVSFIGGIIPGTPYRVAGDRAYYYVDSVTSQGFVINQTTSAGNIIFEKYNVQDSSTPLATVSFGASATYTVVAGETVNFQDNVSYLVLTVVDTGFTSKQVYFLNLTTFTLDATTFALPTVVSFNNTLMSSSVDPVSFVTKVYIEEKSDASNGSTITTIVLPSDSTKIPLLTYFNNSGLFQQFMPLGKSSSAGTDQVTSEQVLATYLNVGGVVPSTKVQLYSTTTNDFSLVAEYNVASGFNSLTEQLVTVASFSTRTLLLTSDGSGRAFGTSANIQIIDITNPVLAQAGTVSTSTVDIGGVGSAVITKIENNGVGTWNTVFGNFADVIVPAAIAPAQQPTVYDSQFINITGLEIDKQNLNLYSTVDWQTKMIIRSNLNATGSQRFFTEVEGSGGPSIKNVTYSNSSLVKLTTAQGFSQYAVPIIGNNDVTTFDLSVTKQNVVVGHNLNALTTTIFEKQLPSFDFSTLKNPVVTQGVINIPTANNVALSSYSFDGVYQWASKVQTDTANKNVSGIAMGKTDTLIYILGNTNSDKIDFNNTNDVTIQSWDNNLDYFYPYEPVTLSAPLYSFLAKYDTTGTYLESDFVLSNDNAAVIGGYVSANQDLNVVDVVAYAQIFTEDNYIDVRNKDGTSASYQSYNYDYVASNTTFSANSVLSLGIRFRVSADYSDVNGSNYSVLTVYKDVRSTGPVDLFEPYETGTGDINYVNRYVYIPILNQNYLIRSASFDSTTNEFKLVLGQKISTNTMVRKPPALFTVGPNTQGVAYMSDRWDTLLFYVGNISTGRTSNFGAISGSNPTNRLFQSNGPVDLSQQYYIVYSYNTGPLYVVPVKSITAGFFDNVYFVQADYSNFPSFAPIGGRAVPFVYLTAFNPNALYTLQFYPAALNMVEYYTVALQNLTIPNRNIRESTIVGTRTLSDFRYVWLEIYNANDADVADTEFVNNTFSNNPNRNNKVIFQIPITSAGGGSNFSFYGSGQTPRIKFNPGFYNLRIRLLDPSGNVVLFDSTPASSNPGDTAFTNGVVDSSLMNITVDLALTKYNAF